MTNFFRIYIPALLVAINVFIFALLVFIFIYISIFSIFDLSYDGIGEIFPIIGLIESFIFGVLAFTHSIKTKEFYKYTSSLIFWILLLTPILMSIALLLFGGSTPIIN